MRFQVTLLALAASLGLVGAQDLSGIPQCAIPCFVAALPKSNCGITDTECQCTSGRAAIENELLTCTPERCEESDISSLAPAVSSLCAAAGVSLTSVPTSTGSMASSMTGSTASDTPDMTSGTQLDALPEQTQNAASANGVAYGGLAMGMAAVLGL